jgi:hypothetical protein
MGTKVSALSPATTLTDFELFPAVQAGGDVKVTTAQIRTYVLAALAPVATSGSASDLGAGTLPAARLPALSGDISTSAGSAVTAIGTNKVTRGMLAQTAAAAFLGATAAGNVADLTIAQAKTLLALGPGDVTEKQPSNQGATSYTAVLGDAVLYTRFTSNLAVTFTIPPNSSVAYPIGTVLEFSQAGTGIITVTAGAGVTVNSRGGIMTTAGQHAAAFIKKIATDTWLLAGDLA